MAGRFLVTDEEWAVVAEDEEEMGLELVLHKGCDFFGQCNCFPRLFFVGIYEVFQRIAYSCAVPAQGLGRQFHLAESRLTLRAFLCEIEQIMD